MKSHDFGQFLFNSSTFDEQKLVELIAAAKSSIPTLPVKALFMRLVSLAELEEKNYSEKFLQTFLTSQQIERISLLDEDNSLKLAQTLVDTKTVDFEGLEKILQEYHRIEIPPVESAFASFYDSLRLADKVDYPLALGVAES